MLQAIRSRAGNLVVKLLFIVLILSFIGFGVENFLLSTGKSTKVAEIGDVTLDQPTFANRVTAELQRYQQALGGTYDRKQLREMGLVEQAMQRVISDILMDQESKHLGLVVSDAMVKSAVENDPSFLDEQGKFDRSKFLGFVARNGYSEARFISELRRQFGGSEILQTVASGSHAPAITVDALLSYRGEKRVATMLFIPDDSVAIKSAKPTDADLEAIHKDKAAQFTAPEYRSLSYVVLSATGLAAGMKATDKELHDSYDSRIDEFTVPERRTVEQVRFDTEALAKAARDKITAGSDFAAIAKDAGQKPEVTSLGENAAGDLPPEFAAAVFALPVNEVSKPIKSDFGWHLLRATAVKPGHVDEFDAVKAKVQKELIDQKSVDALYDRANKLDTVLDGGASLEDAARQLGLDVHAVPAVSHTGKAPDGSDVKDLPAATQLLGSAFDLKQGQTGRPVEVREQNLYFVVRTDSVTEPALRPLADVRDQVLHAWEAEQRGQVAKVRADALAAKVKDAQTLDAVAKGEKLTTVVTSAFTRDGKGTGDLPPAAVGPLFSTQSPGLVTVVRGSSDNGWVIAQLKSIDPVDAEKDKNQRAEIAKSVKDGIQNDLMKQFDAALRQRFPVTIERQAVDAIF